MIGDTAAILRRGRALAESRMTESIVAGIWEDGSDDLGNPTRELVSTLYEGKARLRWATLAVSASDGSGQPVATQQPYASLPVDAPRLPKGTELHVTASTADPLLVGRVVIVQGQPIAGQSTAARYPCEEDS